MSPPFSRLVWTALIAAAIAGSCAACWLVGAYRQAVAVEHVRQVGGAILFEHQVSSTPPSRSQQWLAAVLGEDAVCSVYGVYLDSRRTPASDLRRCAVLTDLRELYLCGPQFDTDDLRAFAWARHLQRVNLNQSLVDDAAAEVFLGWPELEYLNVEDTKFTEHGMWALLDHPSLVSISVRTCEDEVRPGMIPPEELTAFFRARRQRGLPTKTR